MGRFNPHGYSRERQRPDECFYNGDERYSDLVPGSDGAVAER